MALWTFAEEIYSAFTSKKQVVAISLDLTSAFDSVNHDLLVSRLMDISCPTYLAKSIESFLDARSAYMMLDGKSFPFSPKVGVPQGSAISPALFLVFINTLASSVTSGSSISLFADDCLLYRKIDRNKGGLSALQRDIDGVMDWAKKWQMNFNPAKSHLVRFSRLRKSPRAKVHLGRISLAEEEGFKYLGVYFDRKMTFRNHVRVTQTKVTRRLLQIRRLSAPLWGCTPVIVQRLFKACVLSALYYGSEIWSPAAKKKSLNASLLRVHRQGALLIMGAFKTTASAAVIPLAGLNFPEVEIAQRMLRMVGRLELLGLDGSVKPQSGRYASPGSILFDLSLKSKSASLGLQEWEQSLFEANADSSISQQVRKKAISNLLGEMEDDI